MSSDGRTYEVVLLKKKKAKVNQTSKSTTNIKAEWRLEGHVE